MRAEPFDMLRTAPFDRLRAQDLSGNSLSGRGGQMLVHRQPAAVALAGEHDRLALVQSLGARAGHYVGDDVVKEYRRIAEDLNTDRGGFTAGDPKVVLSNPSLPQPPIGIHRLQPLRSAMEDERRVIGETSEVVLKPPSTERGYQPFGRRSDLGFVVAHDSLLFGAGVLGTIMAAR
jgi:hypothetical protein